MRRELQLPEEDVEFLEALDLPWETVRDGGLGRVIVQEFPLPDGYEQKSVSVNLRIEPGYPDTQIDMAYFFPAIQRIDGRAIPATTNDQFDGKQWQRWSRHRTSANPWRPGVDGIGTHVAAIKRWLDKEINRN